MKSLKELIRVQCLIMVALLSCGNAVAQSESLPDSVGPLLTDHWHQYAPYNALAPSKDGEQCVVGCIATAMSQVMRYWQYPESGVGSNTYTDSLGCGQLLSSDFSSHRYDWGNMLDEYLPGEYSQEQADAVALLAYDCGISVNMKYGSSSAASPVRQAMAMRDNFSYDRSIQIYMRDFYTKAEMTLMLKRELAEGRPVLISGYSRNGGHAFVIDGYDSRDWFHINLGNPPGEDNGDCWTPLHCMSPDQPEWYDVDSPEMGLNLLQIFTLGIQPPQTATTENHLFVMHGIRALDTSFDRSDSIVISVEELCNIGCNVHSDSVAIMLCNDRGIRIPLYTYDRTFLLEELDDTTYTDTLSIAVSKVVADGDYRIIPMYRDNGIWTEVRSAVGIPNYLFANVDRESIVLASDTANTAYLTLEDIDIPDLILNANVTDLSLTIKAHNAEMNGVLEVVMLPLEENGVEFTLLNQGFSLDKDEVSCRRFHKTKFYTPKTGRYSLHVRYYASPFTTGEPIDLTPDGIEVSMLHAGIFQIAQR